MTREEKHWGEQRTKRHADLLAAAAHHGHEPGWRIVLEQLDAGFFLGQAQATRSFNATTRDVEQYLLPHLLRTDDADRWLRWAATARYVRDLGLGGDAELVLPALAAGGRWDLARSLAARLPDPIRRLHALSEIGWVVRHEPDGYKALQDQILLELPELRRPSEPEALADWCALLCALGRRHGPKLWRQLEARLDHLPSGAADKLRLAVAEGFFVTNRFGHEVPWRLVGAVASPVGPTPSLFEALTGASEDVMAAMGRRLAAVTRDKPLWRWRFALPALAARVRTGTPAGELWRRAHSLLGELPGLSVDLLDAGRGLWGRLPRETVEAIARRGLGSLDPGPWRVAVLEERSPGDEFAALAAAALEALDEMPAGTSRLHWSLRWLTATRTVDVARRPGRVARCGEVLAAMRHEVAVADLAAYLDAVADVSPERLNGQLTEVLWSPTTDAETLRGLAAHARSPALLGALFERLEEHIVAVAEDPAVGFESRMPILACLVARLEALGERIHPEAVAERLLPSERDELWGAVARLSNAAGHAAPARRAARRVRDPAAALRARLSIQLGEDPADVTLAELYESAAGGAEWLEELRCLEPLVESSASSGELAAPEWGDVEPRRRILAWIDLTVRDARRLRALRGVAGDPSRIHRRLRERLGAIPSDRWSLALTPELARLAVEIDPEEVPVELEEAFVRVADLDDVPWDAREDAFVSLTALLPGVMTSAPWRCRGLAERLARLPDKASRESLRRNWHRVFPWLAAAVVEAAPRRGRRWWSAARWRRRWPWLDARQLAMVDAWETGRSRGDDPAVEQALVVRAALRAPRWVDGVIDRLETTPDRHRLVLRLVTAGRLDREIVEALLERLPVEGGWRARAELTHPSRGLDDLSLERFISALCSLVEEGRLDPSEPRWLRVRWRCWELRDRLPFRLAEVYRRTLGDDHSTAAGHAFRLLLGTLVAPSLGPHDPAAADRLRCVREAIFAARTLGGPRNVVRSSI